jgi:hypothetical protein
MTNILARCFNEPNFISFIDIAMYRVTDPETKMHFIESQASFTQEYRTFLIYNIQTIDIPVRRTESKETSTIFDWFKTNKTDKNTSMFTNVMPAINNKVEIMVHHSDVIEESAWITHAQAYIARKPNALYYAKIFLDHSNINQIIDRAPIWRKQTTSTQAPHRSPTRAPSKRT